VINVAAAVAGEFQTIHDEMQALNREVVSRQAQLKVIFELAYLDAPTKVALCRIAKELQVAFVKTSTGFATGLPADKSPGATLEDVHLMVRESSPVCQVKASGGIRDLETMERFLDAGATRIGTSATRAIVEQARARMG
jgi:deoxyribose-phosphate aldolase